MEDFGYGRSLRLKKLVKKIKMNLIIKQKEVVQIKMLIYQIIMLAMIIKMNLLTKQTVIQTTQGKQILIHQIVQIQQNKKKK